MQKLFITNMETRGGRPAANQFIIETGDGRYFQSYNSLIAFVPFNGGPIVLGPDWDYSNTTRRYLYDFLPYGYNTKKDILAAIQDGRITPGDLQIGGGK